MRILASIALVLQAAFVFAQAGGNGAVQLSDGGGPPAFTTDPFGTFRYDIGTHRLGIGTSSPQAQLHIVGPSTGDGIATIQGGTPDRGGILRFVTPQAALNTQGSIVFQTPSNDVASIVGLTPSASDSGEIHFKTRPAGASQSLATRMFVDASSVTVNGAAVGGLGPILKIKNFTSGASGSMSRLAFPTFDFGTDANSSRIDAVSQSGSTNQAELRFYTRGANSAANEALRLTSDTLPKVRIFSLEGSGNACLEADSTGQIVAVNPRAACGTGSGITGSGSAGEVTFWTGAASQDGDSALTWNNTTKRLGIGNSSPGVPLDVTGDVRSSGQLTSTVATGTAPLAVASTTRVTNLNADQLDNSDGTFYLNRSNHTGTQSHGSTLSGLGNDDHTQYALLSGRGSGQTLTGGTTASGTLTLRSTSNATKGKVVVGSSAYDESKNMLGVGTATPGSTLTVSGSEANTAIRMIATGDAQNQELDENDHFILCKVTNTNDVSFHLPLASAHTGRSYIVKRYSAGAACGGTGQPTCGRCLIKPKDGSDDNCETLSDGCVLVGQAQTKTITAINIGGFDWAVTSN